MKIYKFNESAILAVTYGVYNSIRMLIGVYHAVYLLSANVKITQLAILQVVFSVTVLLFNFPISFISDRYNRKYIVIIGVGLTAIFYLLCIQAPYIPSLILAEIAYGAGLCCISGAIDGWVMGTLGKKKENFCHYAHLCQKVGSAGSIVSGVVGIIIVYVYQSYLVGYILSFGMMFGVLLSFMMVKERKPGKKEGFNKESIFTSANKVLSVLKSTKGGKWFIALTCLFSAGIQIIFHFWQPILLTGMEFWGMSIEELSILVLCHIGSFSAQFIFNTLIDRYKVEDNQYKHMMTLFSFCASLMCLALMFLVFFDKNYMAIIAFSLVHGFICTVPVGAQSLFYSELSQEQTNYISSVTGFVSICGRVFSIIILTIISFLPDNVYPRWFLIIPATTFFFCGLVIVRWVKVKDNKLERRLT